MIAFTIKKSRVVFLLASTSDSVNMSPISPAFTFENRYVDACYSHFAHKILILNINLNAI